MKYKGVIGLCLIAGIFAGCQCLIEKEVVKEEVTPEIVYQDRVVEKIVEVPVEKIVYQDKIVEKIVEVPVEKIVYQDKIVEVPVEKIVYQDKIVEKITIESLNIKDVFFEWDSAKLIPVTEQTLKENAAILRDNPEASTDWFGFS